MGAEDHRRPLFRAADDRLLHAADAERVEAGERLVEDHDVGRVEEAAGDHQFLLHAARELARERLPLPVQLQLLEERREASAVVGDAVDTGGELEVLLDRQVVEEARLVGEEGEIPLRFDAVLDDVVAADQDLAVARRMDAGERAERRRLSGPVRTDEPEDFARLHGEGEVVDGRQVAVALR